jgi:2-polyprenyl-3-methyl-5-hydroxy-6-metoxy-1,4-benzoquinol methylase
MENTWLERWESRYRQAEYAFGTEPNAYLKEQIEKLNVGRILFAAEGEGRNAIFAAQLGWNVLAFDISAEGKNKALLLAKQYNVNIEYQIGELPELTYAQEQFDAIALIYAHFPANIKSTYHKQLTKFLRKDGIIIFEAFSKKHLAYRLQNEKVGGPKDIESLFSIEELQSDFVNFNFLELEEKEIELNEGIYHNGKGSVVRFVAQKQQPLV